MEGVLNYSLSTILIGFLEQGFISMMAIRILKAFDSLQVNKLRKLLLIIAPAVLLNLPELLGLDPYASLIFEMFAMMIFIKLVTNKKFVFVSLAVLGAMALFMATEGIFGYSVMAAAGLTSNNFVGNAPLAFLVSLPERIIQYLIIYFISVNDIKRLVNPRCRKVNIFKIIKSSKTYRICAFAVILIMILYTGIFIELFAVNGLLHSLKPICAILISLVIVCTPYVVLLIFVESLYKSHSLSAEFTEYFVEDLRNKALKAHESAIESGDEKTVENIENMLASLDLDDSDE